MDVEVRTATGTDDYAQARQLIEEYLAALPFEVDFQDVDAELADLTAVYGAPDGMLLLGLVADAPAGVVGLSRFDGPTCEMKRMFVRPAHRGTGLGRRLAHDVITAARSLGYTRMLLDTVQELREANTLYESLGFRDVPPYRYNPRPDARYLTLEL